MRGGPLAALVLTVAATAATEPSAARAAARALRVAVVLGNNRGHATHRPLRYAEADARKFHAVLTELGGFRREDTRLLLGGDASDAWRLLRAAEQQIARFRRQPGGRALLVVFYSGHADGSVLELGESSLRFAALRRFLRGSQADVRLAFVDSCQSGRLVATKGGRPGPGYRILVDDEIASSGYAVLTSSAEDELSQESAEIRGSFFTHYLVSALRGAGGLARDGRVTLAEAYRFAYRRTVARTSPTFAGAQHPMYDFRLRGHGDIVLTRSGHRARLAVSSPTRARVVVLNARADAMVAEGEVTRSAPALLDLTPGRYRVCLLRAGAASCAAASLPRAAREGTVTSIGPADFSRARLRVNLAKGGLFRRPLRHRLAAGVLLRQTPLSDRVSFAYGPSVQYWLESPGGWQPTVQLSFATGPRSDVSADYYDLAGLAGLGYLLDLSPWALRATAFAGYAHLLQEPRAGEQRHTGAFTYLASLGAELFIGRWVGGGLFCAVDAGLGGRALRLREAGLAHRLVLQLSSAIGWRWEGR